MLAPDSATAVERCMDAAAEERVGRLPAGYRAWRVDDLPNSWMPVLAWALSVDLWDSDWTPADRRAAIQTAMDLHRKKGTPAGIKQALDFARAIYDYTEGPAPFTCRITIYNLAGISLASLTALQRHIDCAKRASVVCAITAPDAGLPQLQARFAAGVGAHVVPGRALALRVEE